MPPQIRAAFNWGLLVQVASVLISMGIGAILVVQEQKTAVALDHQTLEQLAAAVREVRSNQISSGVYDDKLLNLQNQLHDQREDFKTLYLMWTKDHNQLLARRYVQP